MVYISWDCVGYPPYFYQRRIKPTLSTLRQNGEKTIRTPLTR